MGHTHEKESPKIPSINPPVLAATRAAAVRSIPAIARRSQELGDRQVLSPACQPGIVQLLPGFLPGGLLSPLLFSLRHGLWSDYPWRHFKVPELVAPALAWWKLARDNGALLASSPRRSARPCAPGAGRARFKAEALVAARPDLHWSSHHWWACQLRA